MDRLQQIVIWKREVAALRKRIEAIDAGIEANPMNLEELRKLQEEFEAEGERMRKDARPNTLYIESNPIFDKRITERNRLEGELNNFEYSIEMYSRREMPDGSIADEETFAKEHGLKTPPTKKPSSNLLFPVNLMTFERFTERSHKIIDLASEEAQRMGRESVNTGHLLLGMLQEGKGVAANVLRDAKVDAENVLAVYDSVENEPDASFEELDASCMLEAKWLGHNYFGTEHLLLGVCGLADCKAVRLLTSMGKSPAELCQFALELLGHAGDWNR